MSKALFLGTHEDKAYLPHLKHMFNGWDTYVVTEPVQTLVQLEMYCAKRGITAIASTNTTVLQKLLALQGNVKDSVSLDNYAGSLFTYKSIDIVFVNPLKQLFTVKYGKFLCQRFISKVVARDTWREPTEFQWAIADPSNIEALYAQFTEAFAIAYDIETLKSPLSIRCIGYTGVFVDRISGRVTSLSIVLPIDGEWALAWMRRFNTIPVRKITQRGKYDNSYLLRYNAAPTDWYWDTANLFHSHYSELPKDLAFLNAFHLRSVVYWKDLAETTDLHEYYRYNALDTWATANVWISQLLTMPDWARHNYVLEFPLNYPCLLAEMTGIKRDEQRLHTSRQAVLDQEQEILRSLQKIISTGFNPSSPVQVKNLLKVLGCGDIESTEEKDLKKAAFRHPLNSYIVQKILTYRGLKKLRTTYLRTDDDITKTSKHGNKEFKGRILYALNPDATDTARLASKEHHFWCGLQIHNIPRGEPGDPSYTKDTICAEDGFFIGEVDLEQAESRDTAYISGDTGYIAAVTGTRDFHSVNASAFFGLPYSDIYDDTTRKTKNKKIRDLSKRTNHGANYNMGAAVMLDTMGLENVLEARRLLGLSTKLSPLQVCEYLLERFHDTYPGLRGRKSPYAAGTYYAWVVSQVNISRRLVSRAFHHTKYNCEHYTPERYIEHGDWTRYCFGNPEKNKPDLNALVAHVPQSLNSRTLNEAWMKVFYEVALPNPHNFRLQAQVHDSILFSYREGFDHLATRVRECMEIPVTLRSVDGEYRTFTVPASLKLGKKVNGTFVPAKYWSETE